MDNTFKSIDLVSEDGSVRFRLKVTDRLVAIRLQRDEKGNGSNLTAVVACR